MQITRERLYVRRRRSGAPKIVTETTSPPVSILRKNIFLPKKETLKTGKHEKIAASVANESAYVDDSGVYGVFDSPTTSSFEQGSSRTHSRGATQTGMSSFMPQSDFESDYDMRSPSTPCTSADGEKPESSLTIKTEGDEGEYCLKWSEEEQRWRTISAASDISLVSSSSSSSSSSPDLEATQDPLVAKIPSITYLQEPKSSYLTARSDNRSPTQSVFAYQQYLSNTILQAETRSEVERRDDRDGDSGWLSPASIGSKEIWEGSKPREIDFSDMDDTWDDTWDDNCSEASSGVDGYETADEGYDDDGDDLFHLDIDLRLEIEMLLRPEMSSGEDDADREDHLLTHVNPFEREKELREAILANIASIPPYIISMTHSRTNTNSSHSLEPEEDIVQETSNIRILRGRSLEHDRWADERMKFAQNRTSTPMRTFEEELTMALLRASGGKRISTSSGGIGYHFQPRRRHRHGRVLSRFWQKVHAAKRRLRRNLLRFVSNIF